jgi:hypothetical protein
MTRNFGCTKVMVRAYEASGLCPSRGSGCGLHRAMDAMKTARVRQYPQEVIISVAVQCRPRQRSLAGGKLAKAPTS